MSSIKWWAAPLGAEGFERSVIRPFLDIFGNPNWMFGRGILFSVTIKMSVMIAWS